MHEHIQARMNEIVEEYGGEVTHWDAQNEIGKLITAFREVPQSQFEQMLIQAIKNHRAKGKDVTTDSPDHHRSTDL